MSDVGRSYKRKTTMKRVKAGLWALIGVTAGICIIVNAASGGGKTETVAVADTVESVERQEQETVATATVAEKKKTDMNEITEGRVVIKENLLKDCPNYDYTKNDKLDLKGLMLHSTGVNIASGERQAKIFGDVGNWDAGIHAVIDANTGVVLHTLPWDQVAWHCGYDSGNGSYIGVEMCETDAGYYTETFQLVIEDEETAKEHVRNTYYSAVKLFAELCIKYKLDPLEEGVIVSHEEGHAMGIASNHGDPVSYWDATDSGYTMDGFRKDVSEYINLFEEEGWELNENL